MRSLPPALLLLVLAAPLVLGEHGDGESGAWPARLPLAVEGASAATDGEVAYLFGGYGDGDATDLVQRLDPRYGNGTSVAGHLPRRVTFAAAAWVGEAAYVFGGRWEGRQSDAILRFDPATGESRTMQARLPWGAEGTMAASDGSVAYVVLGNAVLRYDPSVDRVDVLPIRLPANLTHGAAVWAGGRMLLFGTQTLGVPSDRIVVLDPANGTAAYAEARLPGPRTHVSAAWTGTRAYVFGGGDDATPQTAEVLQYDPEADALRALETRLPTPRSRTAAAFVNGRVYVMAGAERNGPTLDEVWRFTPPAAHDAPPPDDESRPPVARLTLNVSALTVEADASASADPDGVLVKYRIEWGDGTVSEGTDAALLRRFELPGTYRVRLLVTDDDGLTAEAEQEVTLALPLPEHSDEPALPPGVGDPPLPGGDSPIPTAVFVAGGFAAAGAGALLAARALR